MHGAMPDFAVSFQGDGVDIRETEWQGMNVALERFPAGMSTATVFVGLPDDRCQCPHWGYVIRGQVRVLYADHEETLRAGDAGFKHKALVAIGAFHEGFVAHFQIDARMAQGAAATIAGDAGALGFDDFWGLYGHGQVPKERDGADHTR